MYLSRLNIKSYNDKGKKIVKVDFNTIEVSDNGNGIYKSNVSEETIEVTKKNHLFMNLTKMKPNGKIFMFREIDFKSETFEVAEKVFYEKVIKHFKLFSLIYRKEMAKLIQTKNILLP